MSAPGQAAGVRRRRLRARLGDADLQNDDRLDGRRLFRDAQELVAFLDAFQITGDDVGCLVFRERLDEIHLVEVGLVAEADDLAQAELLVGRPVENGHAQRAGLRDDGNFSRRRHRRRERGVHVMVGVEHAQAIRPDHPHAAGRQSSTSSCSALAPAAPTSLKPAVMTMTDLAPGVNRALEGVLHVFARHDDDAEVNLAVVFGRATCSI